MLHRRVKTDVVQDYNNLDEFKKIIGKGIKLHYHSEYSGFRYVGFCADSFEYRHGQICKAASSDKMKHENP